MPSPKVCCIMSTLVWFVYHALQLFCTAAFFMWQPFLLLCMAPKPTCCPALLEPPPGSKGPSHSIKCSFFLPSTFAGTLHYMCLPGMMYLGDNAAQMLPINQLFHHGTSILAVTCFVSSA